MKCQLSLSVVIKFRVEVNKSSFQICNITTLMINHPQKKELAKILFSKQFEEPNLNFTWLS